jgi:rhodanese-related sulfurtransferase
MKHYKQFLRQYAVSILLILPLLIFASACSDDDDAPITPAASEAELLIAELEGGNGDYMNTTCPSIVRADAVHDNVTGAKTWYIIDIRAADAYATGHVPGAVNVPRADIFTHMATINAGSYDKIVIVCYSGQSAAWTTSLLRLSGIMNVASMKYGMSSWHSDFDTITGKKSDAYASQFVKTASPAKPAVGVLPTISTGKTTGAEILAARVAAVHADDYGMAATDAATVFASPDQYFIVNYWVEADYLGLGHFPGAYQYTPKEDLKLSAFLLTLPTDKTIAVYCYTGQTSANIAVIPRVLGYDAKSISFGTQGMIWQTMIDNNKTAYNVNNSSDCWGFDVEK